MSNNKTHWENIYRDKNPHEVSWFQKEPSLSLQLIRDSGVAHNAAVIDIGGGASVLVRHLIHEGYSHLSVLDISSKALAYARQSVGDDAKKIEWFEQDVTQFIPPHRFSLWHDRAVFHFLTDEKDRKDYVKVLKKTLERNGALIIAAFAIGGPKQCSGLDIVQYDAKKLLAELGDDFELIEQKDESHITPGNQLQTFSYFRLIRK